MTKIVLLDGYTCNPGDLSWDPISALGDFKVYDRTAENLIYQRGKAAEVVIVNKLKLDAYYISRLRKLKCICLIATGYNNVDVWAANERGIVVCNAVGYGTSSVAQHVFALLLELSNRVGIHHESVQAGEWASSADWSYWKHPMMELSGKTMGIYGLGKIGQKVADIALAFGMKVIAHHKHPQRDSREGVEFVSLKRLFVESDVLSLHAPLTNSNLHLINHKTLALMKASAYLINTGRGGLVNEQDLKEGLMAGEIAGAGLDVLSQEPPPIDHPLMGVPNCLITPHHAWACTASRQRLIQIVADNIKAYQAGTPQNLVTPSLG